MENKTSPLPITSPPPVTNSSKETTMSFPDAVKEIIKGKKITKLEWGNKNYYGFLDKEKALLVIHKPDNSLHQWLISEGDLLGNDFITL